MKIAEGMYVRTLDGISKIIELRDNGVMKRFVNEDGNVYFLHDILGKPSYKIIDLIEIGDYVNGYKVSQIGKSIENRKYITTEAYHKINYGNVFEKEIETIITKEQFEREAYKI